MLLLAVLGIVGWFLREFHGSVKELKRAVDTLSEWKAGSSQETESIKARVKNLEAKNMEYDAGIKEFNKSFTADVQKIVEDTVPREIIRYNMAQQRPSISNPVTHTHHLRPSGND